MHSQKNILREYSSYLIYAVLVMDKEWKVSFAMKKVYMDNAGTTFPKPECVVKSMLEYMTGRGVNSFGWNNTKEDVDAVLKALEEICYGI